ncbi:unnamed protein product [Candidula unifasciata]|uniref:DUF4200 domain-containing protein n=1 Tax=Candidula unifasciata TaxID=100452 RepID=A0A8S3ZKZ0_9EUPU|nr:unnamed protein product [Candidula unifasciata]
MANPAVYKLELEEQKRRVFVTQLHDREDEEDVTYFPVIKESADRLLENGVNTLQKTLLLKKEVEVDKVNAELEAKRYEFKQRMEMCAHRQAELQRKQQQMKDRVEKFEKFIQENDAKRRRAIQKYQQEVRQKEQKALEFISLSDQLQHLKTRHQALQTKLRKYKVYEEYLQNVVDAMPEDYLPATEDKIKSLMMRYKTLSESNKHLVNNLEAMADELEECKIVLEMMNQDHQKSRLASTSQILHFQEKLEQIVDQNEQQEQNFVISKGEKRAKRTEVGVIFMALDNIYDKCQRSMDQSPNKADWQQKLSRIQEFVKEREDILDMVQNSGSPTNRHPVTEKTKTKSKKHERRKLTFAVPED